MAKQPHPIAVRLSPPLSVGEIDAIAERRGEKRNAILARWIAEGIQRDQDHSATNPKAILAQAEAKAAHLATPKPRKRSWNLKGVQLGPSHAPLGSRLKDKAPKGNKR